MPAIEVTVTLKAAMTVDQYESDPEAVKGPLRTELGCHEPLCVLTVTVAPGSLILTVVATDRAPGSQVHSLATAMGTSDLSTLSASLNITLTEAPAVQPARSTQIIVVLLAPSPPPPVSPPFIVIGELEASVEALSVESGEGLAYTWWLWGALLVLLLCCHFVLIRFVIVFRPVRWICKRFF